MELEGRSDEREAEASSPIGAGDDATSLRRRLVSEFVATSFLVATVIGSGIAAERLSDSAGIALLINAAATAAGLIALILAFGPSSGAHMNPVVSAGQVVLRGLRWTEAIAYAAAQLSGALVGAVFANVMFSEPVIEVSRTDRFSGGHVFAEVIATFGLLAVILGCARARRPDTTVAFAVGAYIGAAFFFTASTSFANPAVTFGRMFSDTFTGIAPHSALAFVPAQILGAALGMLLLRYLYPVGSSPRGNSP